MKNLFSYKDLFSYKGRMTRKEFAILHLLYALYFVIGLPIMYIIGETDSDSFHIILLAFLTVIVLPVLVIQFFAVVKRLRDLNHSGWFFLIYFIPYVNVLFWLYLLFKPSVKKREEL